MQREEAYVEFMRGRFGDLPDDYVQRVPSSLAGGEAALHRPAQPGRAPDGGLRLDRHQRRWRAARRLPPWARNVPRELSVVGWDDLAIAAYTIPGLTTLRMPTHDIVVEAVKTAVALVADRSASPAPTRTIGTPRSQSPLGGAVGSMS